MKEPVVVLNKLSSEVQYSLDLFNQILILWIKWYPLKFASINAEGANQSSKKDLLPLLLIVFEV